MLTLKHFRTLRHVSLLIDHHQGVRRCLVKSLNFKKITDFKILKSQSWWCGSMLCCHITTIDSTIDF